MKNLFIILLNCTCSLVVNSQKTVPLYDGTVPNSKPFESIEKTTKDANGNVIIRDISMPTISIFPAPAASRTGAAVIICPGGGYWVNAIKHEGTDVALEFQKKGVSAFVLKYRIPDERWMINTSIGPLQDAQRAIYFVRSHARQWGIDSSRIGIMGFSAGGHLASTLATHYEKPLVDDPEGISLRPDFMMLIYPLTTTDTLVNGRNSLEKLLGKNADSTLVSSFSSDKLVDENTPPAFIVQATNDELSVRNSLVFYEALIRKKVKTEMHLYQGGGHGFGLLNKTTGDRWIERCFNWMAANGWLTKR